MALSFSSGSREWQVDPNSVYLSSHRVKFVGYSGSESRTFRLEIDPNPRKRTPIFGESRVLGVDRFPNPDDALIERILSSSGLTRIPVGPYDENETGRGGLEEEEAPVDTVDEEDYSHTGNDETVCCDDKTPERDHPSATSRQNGASRLHTHRGEERAMTSVTSQGYSMDQRSTHSNRECQLLDNIPDGELLALLMSLVREDTSLAEKLAKLRLTGENARHIEAVGPLLLGVPELRGLPAKWPEYKGNTREHVENRVSILGDTDFFASLLEWLAFRLWEPNAEPGHPGADRPSQDDHHGERRGVGAEDGDICPSADDNEEDGATGRSKAGVTAPSRGTRFCDAATNLLDATESNSSPYYDIWKRLTSGYPNDVHVTIVLERIEVVQEETRDATEDALRDRGWEIDAFTCRVLDALDEALTAGTGGTSGRI